ncbi:hypothetical protein [Clostridium sp.]|uniref:hypothetical protein n=1 Tax=Clostridium sp. TaxID=1506 RepID=UPI0032167550
MSTLKKRYKNKNEKTIKKNRRIFMISIIGLFLIITAILIKNDLFKETMGTKSGNLPIKDEKPFEVKLTDKITSILAKNLNISENKISILSVSDVVDVSVAMFIYEDKDKSYEGLCEITNVENSYNLLATSIKEVDIHAPFTVNTMETKGSLTENYKILGGVINDPNIKSININFNNNTMTNILIGEDKSYFYVTEEKELEISTIEALDDSFKIFYQWHSKEKGI